MNYARKISVLGIALLAALATTIIAGSWVVAAAVPPDSGATKIALTTIEVNQGKNTNISISARLTQGNQPLGNEPVEFDIAANFFGDRQVNLGAILTDATGSATLIYQPRWDGTQVITAHFKGDGPHPQVDVTKTITFSGSVPQYAPEPVGLTPVRQWITPVIGLCVVIFWALLLFVGLRTLLWIYCSRSRKLLRPQYIRLKGGNLGETLFQDKDSENKV